jgi:hypothetical protein
MIIINIYSIFSLLETLFIYLIKKISLWLYQKWKYSWRVNWWHKWVFKFRHLLTRGILIQYSCQNKFWHSKLKMLESCRYSITIFKRSDGANKESRKDVLLHIEVGSFSYSRHERNFFSWPELLFFFIV